MKIEKISDTQIQVTLNHSDLMDRNIKISELAYGSKKAQALFKDMMARAYEDFGFETENVPLMIEAVPLSTDSIMIVVTKVEDPMQIEQKLDAIGERPTHRTFKEPEEDRMTDLALMGRDEKSNDKKESINKVKSLTYLFGDFDTVCMASHRLQSLFIGDSSLYKYNDKYFLVLNKNKKAHMKAEGLVGILDEFALRCQNTDLNELFLKEHGQELIRLHAIDVLAKYL
ncbi:competence protein [Sporanaerobium hydrogeniformans]|uniref:Competence protein n=1 Tax=Sporanaerobium hydrogeniformans TaxID=3072179 RepID=A0AC61DCB2_9FIRM|nr:adaptor protein MecA [Sporanaerobium hydrogeniformans]PHV70390.1 competence protein [Sporanaerobium hydrogeniformans]